MENKIKLSVIIPVYNQEILVEKALYSVPNREDIQIIVVNDGSTDDTNITIQNWLNNSIIKNIKTYINRENNKGVSATINEGLQYVQGEYVVLLGSDDYFTDNIERVIEQANGDDLVYFDLEINSGEIFPLTPETKNSYCGSTKLMRHDFIKGILNDETKKYGEDYYFYCELLKRAPSEKFTHLVAKHYNFPREGSLSWQQRNSKK